MKPTYVVVAGGAGLLGSKLCARLLETGEQHIFCIDNLSQGKEENLSSLVEHPRFTFLCTDICDSFLIPGKVSQVYHLCDQAKDSIAALKVRGEGTLRLLERAALDHARFLLVPAVRASYQEVPVGVPHAEALALAFAKERKEDIRVVRLASLFGPKQELNDGMVGSFIQSALQRRPIPVEGDGSSVCSILYIEDAVDGLISIMEKEELTEKTLFLRGAEQLTQRELARLIARACGTRVRLAFDPLGIDSEPKELLETEQTTYEWEPQVSLEDALSKTADALKPFITPLPKRKKRREVKPALTTETLFRGLN